MTAAPDPPPAPLTDPPHLAVPPYLTCTNCGYSLRGLDRMATCPECGYSVLSSLAGDPIDNASAPWLAQVARGYRYQGVGFAACCGCIVLFCGSGGTMPIPILGVLILLPLGLRYYGVLRAITAEPGRLSSRSESRWRWGAWIGVGVATGSILCAMTWYVSGLAPRMPAMIYIVIKIAIAADNFAMLSLSHSSYRLATRAKDHENAIAAGVAVAGFSICFVLMVLGLLVSALQSGKSHVFVDLAVFTLISLCCTLSSHLAWSTASTL